MPRLGAFALCFAVSLAVSAQSPTPPAVPLADQVASILSDPAISRDHWGIVVTTLDGQPLYGLNQGQLFQPASNAKLFTTAAALALLGPERTFDTTVRGTLASDSQTVVGDLVIVGGGDANLSGRQLPYTAPNPDVAAATVKPDPLRYLADLADQVAAKGVKHVTGDIVGDDTLFPWEPYPEDWALDDTVWGYGAPVSALSIVDNQLRLTVTPGTITGPRGRETYHGGTAKLEQNGVPYYTVDARVDVTPRTIPSGVQVDRAPGSRTLRLYGQMAEGSAPDVEQIAIDDPAEYAAMAFRAMLQVRGIAVDGAARAKHQQPRNGLGFLTQLHLPDTRENLTVAGGEAGGSCMTPTQPGTVLATHRSVPLYEDVILTNKVSQNLHAELLLHHLGRRVFCGDGSTASGARMVRAFLIHAGLDPGDFVFFDGSGLSGHDLVTPAATAKLLSYATTQPWFAFWKSSLPVAGRDGSLSERFARPPLQDHVFAKTGTLSEARALSGYLDAASGRTVIFSIMVGDHLPSTSADRDAMDRLIAVMQASE